MSGGHLKQFINLMKERASFPSRRRGRYSRNITESETCHTTFRYIHSSFLTYFSFLISRG